MNFIAELDGKPGAAGALCLHDGVALFAGASTIPEMRRRGLQAALLEARKRYAFDTAIELAMMVTEAGSQSQRNAERQGFRIAYTRTKWRLQSDLNGWIGHAAHKQNAARVIVADQEHKRMVGAGR